MEGICANLEQGYLLKSLLLALLGRGGPAYDVRCSGKIGSSQHLAKAPRLTLSGPMLVPSGTYVKCEGRDSR